MVSFMKEFRIDEEELMNVTGGRKLYPEELEALRKFEKEYIPILDEMDSDDEEYIRITENYYNYIHYILNLPVNSGKVIFDVNTDYSKLK